MSSDSSGAGYLDFTRTSLYRLTLPLAPPSPSASDKPADTLGQTRDTETPPSPGVTSNRTDPHDRSESSSLRQPRTWEQEVEDGNDSDSGLAESNQESGGDGPIDSHDANAPAHSVIFLLHSGQPLSYLASLISAEDFDTSPASSSRSDTQQFLEPHLPSRTHTSESSGVLIGSPRITFHSGSYPYDGPPPGKRWSPATGLGDFLRSAARAGSFTVCISDRRICVRVPSFASRTRFLRAELYRKTLEIQRLAKVKSECDHVGRRSAQRVAVSGAGVLGVWWLSVGYLTFHTELGWDTMEPITYLTGLGTVISSYLWFLWHNREVSYRSVLTETTSRRQQKLYAERGFDIERYNELVSDSIEFRKSIKRIASDYGLEWDQGETELGKSAGKALEIVRKEEVRIEKNGKQGRDARDDSDEEEEEEDEQEAVIGRLSEDTDVRKEETKDTMDQSNGSRN